MTEGLAARALAEAGIDRPAVEARVLEVVPRQGAPLLENPPYIPQASLALQGRDTLAARILGDLGAARDPIEARLVERITALAARR